MQAGLFPRLRQQNILPVYLRLDMRDRSAPLIDQTGAALQAEVARHGVDAPAPRPGESLWEHLHGRKVAWWSAKNQPLTPLFVFDQFEEAFTLGAENTEAIERLRLDLADLIENRIPEDLARRIEAGALAEELDLQGQRYRALLRFREDFLPEVEGWKGELPSLLRNRLRLLSMSADRAFQVVSGETPARRTHELVSDETAREIVRFVAAVQTGDDKFGRGKRLRTVSDLSWNKLEIEPALLILLCEGLNEKRKARAVATIDAALLKETGEAIIGDFYRSCVADVPEKTRRFIEGALITEGGFRNSYPLEDALDQGLLTEPLLRQLVDRRLLRIDHQLGADRVELIHDRLTDVVREHRDRERERVRKLRQRRWAFLLGTGAAVFFSVAAALAVLYWQAQEALQAARDQTRVAVAGEWLAKDPTRAALVLLEVEHPDDTPYAIARMTEALRQGLSSARYGHGGEVRQAAFSPDGSRIVTASEDGTARVWRADGTGEPVVLKGHEGGVNSAAFSPDGARIVTASRDNTARVWRADGIGGPVVLKGHEHDVSSAAFSPDGARIVTASEDGTARVWQADGTGEPVVLKGHEYGVSSAVFSPDGARIVTASWDGTARVWQADGTGEPVVLKGHEAGVWSAAFSADGARIVTASGDKTARVWQADGIGGPIVLKGHEGGMNSAAFSPDGARIVTASRDNTARVWRADGTGEPVVLKGHEGGVSSAVFSPDGARIVTASGDNYGDKTARVWRADGTGEPVVLKGHEGGVNSAAFSPDGARIVTASEDGTARVWRADGIGGPVVLKGHEYGVSSAAFSPDGARIVTASRDNYGDKTARVWRADGTGEPVVLKGHEGGVNSAAFSPDGARIVTASEDGTARVWRADGTGEPVVFKGHEGFVSSAVFSPDGTRIVTTASHDKTARVWQADGTGEPVVLKGHEDGVNSAAFSPDGARIVTASEDGTARVWRADGTGEPVVLKGHEDGVNSAAFSPDGARIVTASDDNTARVWALSGERLQAAMRPAAHQCLDPPFRKRYLGEPPEEALQKYQACERAHGRSGTFAQ